MENIINLKEYMGSINEEAGKRGRPKKTDAERKADLNQPKNKPVDQSKIKPNQVDTDSLMPNTKDVWGKDAELNGSGGVWEVDAPKDEKDYPFLDEDTLNNNLAELKAKFAAEEDFFIQGEAGWGKTSLIVDMAGRYKRYVVTVYLDKAEAVELGGTPYLDKNPDGTAVTKYAMPAWADLIWRHKDKKFLLFFDEMNQAQTDVMQALMPIILKHSVCGLKFDNFFVGAAGNKEDEAELTSLSKPLKSRLDPIIKWENDWNQAMSYLHGKWDEKIGKDFVDAVDKLKEMFKNPREIEMKLFQFFNSLKKNNDYKFLKVNKIYDRLERLTKYEDDPDEMPRMEKDGLKKLAEKIWNWLRSDSNDFGGSGEAQQNRRGKDMLPQNLKEIIKQAVIEGYYDCADDGNKYGFSKENISCIVPIWNEGVDKNGNKNEPINAQMLERHIRVILAEKGASWKYEKNEEWKKAGYEDPEAPDDDE